MKKIIINTTKVSLLLMIFILGSCKKFIDIIPKGSKIPTTFADYEAMIRDESTNHLTFAYQAILLLNDRFETSANLGFDQVAAANYAWNETADRVMLNNTSERIYYSTYAAISSNNLLIKYVPGSTEATDAAKAELIAQAKILRAYNYYQLANYYADTYESSNAATKRSVPLILSPDVDAPYTQVSIAELYAFMLKDIEDAIPSLSPTSASILHPTMGAAYALRARIMLQMGRYQDALTAADEALKYNNKLFDWTAYYAAYKAKIEQPGVYNLNPSPMGMDFVENYYFRHGVSTFRGRESGIRVDRAARFETGDARFASRWKLRTLGTDTYYYSVTTGFFNHLGLTTTEIYLIKAECQARLNDVPGALITLDKIRVKRIFAQNYSPSVANTTVEAVKLIQRTKANELILGLVPFADIRRLNKDPQYARTLTKTENGQQFSLSPSSHMWTMPFPLGATSNPGNGTIQQNVGK